MKAPQVSNGSASEDCSCGHDHNHDHDHSHDHGFLALWHRWLLSVVIVIFLLICLRSFIIAQMLVRVTSYAANSSYGDEIRICHKIIAIDHDNRQAWTSLGYAYMDLSQTDRAIDSFDHVLLLYPEDKGAASFELGQAYYLKGDFHRAIEYFERIRSVGLRAGVLLEADILKFRHGTLGFRSLNSMQTLLGLLLDCYKKTGNAAQIAAVQKEYDFYKNKQSRVLF